MEVAGGGVAVTDEEMARMVVAMLNPVNVCRGCYQEAYNYALMQREPNGDYAYVCYGCRRRFAERRGYFVAWHADVHIRELIKNGAVHIFRRELQ